MLRNETSTSLSALNVEIRSALKEFNEKPFQKRQGSRMSIFENEEKPYLKRDANILYELFEQRCGTNPTIFVGQYPVDEWHDRPGGGTQADSIMDRIVCNAYEIPTSETNLRKIYDTKRLKNSWIL